MSKCNPKTVIAIAEAEVGYKEKASNSQLDSKTANEGTANWNKYARDIDTKYPDFYNGKKNGYDWCDIFVDWCFIQAYGRADAQKLLCQPNNSCGAGCPYSYGYYKAKGQVGTAPKLGAQIFFGKSQSELQHTGLVVDFDDTSVYTVEGNTGAKVNEVKKKKYARNNSNIFGYGYPAFDDVDIEPVKPTPTPAPAPSKSVDEIAKEVIDGKWGNGDERKKRLTDAGYNYDEVQRKVNQILEGDDPTPQPTPQPSGNEIKASQPAKSFQESLAGTYKVNSASGLNVRDGAGTEYKVLTAIPNGKRVECYGYYTGSWLYIAFEQGGTKYIGFASKDWLSR